MASLSAQDLDGAWVRVAEWWTSPDTSWHRTTRLQPSLYIFSGKYYSITLVPDDAPRAALPANPTDSQRLVAFNRFIANAGTFDRRDSTLTIRPLVAKNPNSMNGWTHRMVLRQHGDSLWLIERLPWRRDPTQETVAVSLLIRRR
jgi:hypothetical protein